MNWQAVPVAIMAGITGYIAILFAGLYFALAKLVDERTRREYRTFALACVAVVAYDISCVGLYNADSLEQGFFWQRGNLFTAGFLGVAYIHFIWDFLKEPIPRTMEISSAILTILAIIIGFWESPYTLTLQRPAIKHIHTFVYDTVYFEVEAGILSQALMGIFFTVFVINVKHLVGYFLSHRGKLERGKLGILLAIVISGITASNDILITTELHTFVYTFEYGIAALLMAMCYVLLMRFGDLHEAINSLNRDLFKMNNDLSVALRQARESVQAKTEFLASMSHELRTPLNAIINIPEGLLNEFKLVDLVSCRACGADYQLEKDEVFNKVDLCNSCGAAALQEHQQMLFKADATKAQGYLRTVAKAGRHLLGLLNQILDTNKLELGRMVIDASSFHLADLVSEVIDATRPLAEKRSISLRLLGEYTNTKLDGYIIADRVKIGQVLYNLISNAIKFSHENGSVEVTLCAHSDDGLEIGVHDHGIGIKKEHHATIFDNFYQVKGGTTRAYGGTGLGLAISKNLIELHGGRIGVESSLGNGASFFVQLPLTPPNHKVAIELNPKEGH